MKKRNKKDKETKLELSRFFSFKTKGLKPSFPSVLDCDVHVPEADKKVNSWQ